LKTTTAKQITVVVANTFTTSVSTYVICFY